MIQITDIAAAVLSWYVSNLLEFIIHNLSHMRINFPILRDLQRNHSEHHKKHYPIGNLLRDGPYKGEFKFGPFVALILSLAWYILPTRYFVIYTTITLLFLGTSGYLHR